MINHPLLLPNGMSLANRIVKSAMSEALGSPDHNPTEALIALYRRWGQSGAGVLITGNTPVDRQHLEHAGNVVLDEKSDLDAFRKLTKTAKAGGAKLLIQLAHAGRQTPAAINPQPLSISDVKLDLNGYAHPKEASEHDFESVIQQFVTSAQLAEEAGFDGVEVHAAHGYLLSSALSPRINTRQDRWGGSVENRARLVTTILKKIRAQVRPDFIVAVKLNSADFQKGGLTLKESVKVAQLLQAEGIDFIEVSGGNFEAPVSYQYQNQKTSTLKREAYFLEYAQTIKENLHIPVMTTGGFRSLSVMRDAIEKEQTDLIGMGRPFIIDPLFPKKLIEGSLKEAPSIERNFPDASTLPKGAALNWFCHQLTLPEADITLPLLEGHNAYLNRIEEVTKALKQ